MVLSLLVLIGCGAAADSQPSGDGIPDGYPTIAPPEFHGIFEISGVAIAGQPLDLGTASTRQITFDVVTGAVTVDLGCDRRLGSFTLAAGGQASITLTGRIEVDPCPPSDLDGSVVDLAERIERWESTDGGFRLVAAGGDNLVLSEL
ncbi:MAG: hypothetical protein OES24_12690 [Acidimicrobiia bacterium]|nr:hypothetical protein [Acidimicrobiia bacterium]